MSDVLTTRVEGNIGIVKIDEPPVNVLSASVRRALIEGFAAFGAEPAIAAIVLICGGRTFIAGFDITEFENGFRAPPLQAVVDTIDAIGKPVVAAIHGTALGGGFELALLCSHRILVPSAGVGLPEVHVGLIPGAGGTQRLPRMVGPEVALELLISGRLVEGPEALSLGLVDELAEEGELERDAVAFARRIVARGGDVPRAGDRQDLVAPYRGKPAFFAEYGDRVAREFRGFKAPGAMVKAVEIAVECPIEEGLEREKALVYQLLETREAMAQRHAFFAERSAAKVPDLLTGTKVRSIRSVKVVGEGEAASTIIAWFQRRGQLISTGTEPCDLVIIAGSEPAGMAREIAAVSGASGSADTIIALNGCFAQIDTLAAAGAQPERVISLHLPAPESRLVELVGGVPGSEPSMAATISLLRRLGAVPVQCRPSADLIVDRLQTVLAREMDALKADGISGAEIDRALFDYGLPGHPAPGEPDPDTQDEILARLLYLVVNEGARMLDEGIVIRASDIDVAAIHGLGWPVYTGGPMFWADGVGMRVIVDWLEAAAIRLGERFRPCSHLTRLAA